MNLPPLEEILRQAQSFTERLAEFREELSRERVHGTAGGGMVTVEADGCGRILAITLESQVVNPSDIEMLQDLVVAATNQALTLAKEKANQKTRSLTGGLPFPGLDGLLFQ